MVNKHTKTEADVKCCESEVDVGIYFEQFEDLNVLLFRFDRNVDDKSQMPTET